MSGSAGGFEQFDYVAGRILHQDLTATPTFDDVTAKRDALGLEIGNHGIEAFLTSRDRSVLESDHIAGVLACGWV